MASRLFNGTTDKIVADGSGIDETGAISFSIFAKANSGGGTGSQRFFMFRDGTQGFMLVFRGDANDYRIMTNNDTGTNWGEATTCHVSGDATEAVWQCVQGTVSSGASGKTITKALIDGVAMGDTFDAGHGDGDDLDEVTIGLRSDGSLGFEGLLAHAQIWQGSLTDAQFNQARFFPGTVVDDIKLYLPIFAKDSPEPDLSGQAKPGTVTGTTVSTDGPPVILGVSPIQTTDFTALVGVTRHNLNLLGVGI